MKNKSANGLKIGELPHLRMIDLAGLRFHEEHDEVRMLALVARFGTEGYLKHPPVVASTDKDREFILLDGANRVTALRKLNFQHIPVQVVSLDDPLLTLSSWHHAIERYGKAYFLENIRRMKDLEVMVNASGHKEKSGVKASKNADKTSGDGNLLCTLTFNDNESLNLRNSSGLSEKVKHLKFITDLYLHAPCSDRVSYTNIDHLRKNYPEFQTLILFNDFSKDEICRLAESGQKLPSGITRVILPKRALGLNVSLEFLKSSLTLEEKNHWLEEMIHKKVIKKSIRFYQEQTFMFNE